MHRISTPSYKQNNRNVRKRGSLDEDAEESNEVLVDAVTEAEVFSLVSPVKEPVQLKSAIDLLRPPAPLTFNLKSLSGYSIQTLISDWYDKK
jgi:hypothetical protein